MSIEDDFPEQFTPEAKELRRRRLACWPEPPAEERFVYKGTPFTVAVIERGPSLSPKIPGELLEMKMVTVDSQERMDDMEANAEGPHELSIRRQYSILADKQPESVGVR